jgi:nitrogen regulatory protein P-II 1
MSMILFVLHDAEKLQAVLEAWEEAGISGATVLFSTGIGQIRESQALRDDLPIMPSLEDFYPAPENLGRTIFTITDDESLVEKILQATETVVGDLTETNRGILTVLPTNGIYGLRKPPWS